MSTIQEVKDRLIISIYSKFNYFRPLENSHIQISSRTEKLLTKYDKVLDNLVASIKQDSIRPRKQLLGEKKKLLDAQPTRDTIASTD